MHKSTAQAEQFYTRTGNESTKPSRKGFSLLGGGESPVAVLTDEQQHESRRAAIVRELERLKVEGSAAKNDIRRCLDRNNRGPVYHEALARKKRIAKRLSELQAEFSEMKKRYPGRDLRSFFIDICKERLSPVLYEQIMNEAKARATKETAA